MKSREGNHVDCKLAKISVQLAREAEAGGDTRHGERYKVIEVTIGRCCQLQSAEADVVEGLVVDAEGLVSVLDQLVDGEGGVVGLHNGVGHLPGGGLKTMHTYNYFYQTLMKSRPWG